MSSGQKLSFFKGFGGQKGPARFEGSQNPWAMRQMGGSAAKAPMLASNESASSLIDTQMIEGEGAQPVQ